MEEKRTRPVSNAWRPFPRGGPTNVLLVGSEDVFTKDVVKRIFRRGRFRVVARSSGLLEAIVCLQSSFIDVVLLSREFREEELALFAFDVRRNGFAGFIWHGENMREDAPETQIQELNAVQIGDFLLEYPSQRVWIRGIETKCSPLEFDLLMFLCKHPEELLNHTTLLESLWGRPSASPHLLRTLICALRAKIETTVPPRYIVTKRSSGYRFIPSPNPIPQAEIRVHVHEGDAEAGHG